MTIKKTTFRWGLRIGFLFTLLAAVVIALSSLSALKSLKLTSLDFSLNDAQDLIDAEHIATSSERAAAAARGFLLTNNSSFLVRLGGFEKETQEALSSLKSRVADKKSETLIKNIEEKNQFYREKEDKLIQHRKDGLALKTAVVRFEERVLPARLDLEAALSEMKKFKQSEFESGKSEMFSQFSRTRQQLLLITTFSLAIAGILALLFSSVLTRLYQKLYEAISARDEVLSVVSHDLKNPLAAIQMAAQLMQKSLKDNSSQSSDKLVQLILSSSKNMEALIQDLLTASRFESGEIPLESKLINVPILLQETIEDLTALAEKKQIKIRTESKDFKVNVLCDPLRVKQVLSNLLGNAIKFSPQGSFISISTSLNANEIEVCIQDQGAGIPKDQLSYIFDRFKQIRKSDARQGSGLGLFICKKIIEAHHGHIWAENVSSGHGALFRFTLPITELLQIESL